MLLIRNITQLVQVEEKSRRWVAGKDMDTLTILENAFLLIKDGKIADFGTMEA